jgi:leucyl-tRNA synthetase
VVGVWRFLNRVWNYYQKQISIKNKKPDKNLDFSEFERSFHTTLKKVTEDIESLRLNTAISSLMILFKEMESLPTVPLKYLSDFIIMLSCFAPFISEEIWRNVLGNKKSVSLSKWPKLDEKKSNQQKITLAVQINGKTRAVLDVFKGISKEKVLELVSANQKLSNYLKNAKIKKVIFVPDKIINILI